jgi:hypothetical protein
MARGRVRAAYRRRWLRSSRRPFGCFAIPGLPDGKRCPTVDAVGYSVRPMGRLYLREADETAAVAAVKAIWAVRSGNSNVDEFLPDDTLADIAWAAAVAVTRDGDWIEFGYDDEGDPKWSDRATAFYVALAPFVGPGRVDIEGEDGAAWSYIYADGQISQEGWNGWDGSIEPFGEPVDLPSLDAL